MEESEIHRAETMNTLENLKYIMGRERLGTVWGGVGEECVTMLMRRWGTMVYSVEDDDVADQDVDDNNVKNDIRCRKSWC